MSRALFSVLEKRGSTLLWNSTLARNQRLSLLLINIDSRILNEFVAGIIELRDGSDDWSSSDSW